MAAMSMSKGVAASPPRCSVVHAWLPVEIVQELEAEAARRRQHPDALVAELVDLVVSQRLFRALLDS